MPRMSMMTTTRTVGWHPVYCTNSWPVNCDNRGGSVEFIHRRASTVVQLELKRAPVAASSGMSSATGSPE